MTGGKLIREDAGEALDVVVLWWRDEDGVLTGILVDARVSLPDSGPILLRTPKAECSGHGEPGEIGEVSKTAGLTQTKSLSAAANWTGTRLLPSKPSR